MGPEVKEDQGSANQGSSIVTPDGRTASEAIEDSEQGDSKEAHPIEGDGMDSVTVEEFIDAVVASNTRKTFMNKFGGVRGVEIERTFVDNHFAVRVNNKKNRIPEMDFLIKTKMVNKGRISVRIYAAAPGEEDKQDQEYVAGFKKTIASKMVEIVDEASDLMVEGVKRAIFEPDKKQSA